MSSLVAFIWSNKFVNIDFIGSVFVPLVSSLGMGVVVFVLGNIIPLGILGVISMLVIGAATYVLILYLFLGEDLKKDFRSLYAIVTKR